MAHVEKIDFTSLPEISESPLGGNDLLTIMRWAVDRRKYVKVLSAKAREAGDNLDELWRTEPEKLIGSIDNPALTRFLPARAYGVFTEFGKRTAQLAAYDKLSKEAVDTLNSKLRSHFHTHDTEISVRGHSADLGTGIYELHHGGHAWGSPLYQATGLLVDINVAEASLWLKGNEEYDYGVRLLSLFSSPEQSEYLELSLNYPVHRA